ncbi:MAG: pirin family protein [Bacteroidia bacterium]
METIIHRANSRGHANHGWLDAFHTFSFASYMNRERMHFGALRVLNDDTVQGGMGFGMHPHDNMEIVTIPLQGALEHKDTTGRNGIIRSGDVQIMSAGKGLYHSEFNHYKDQPTSLLQIWVFPKEHNIEPRYDQKTFDKAARKNTWQSVVAPDNKDALWINQDAWFHLTDLEKGKVITYTKQKADSVLYLFVIEGKVKLGSDILERRDGAGISGGDGLALTAEMDAELLLMEVPATLDHRP